MGGIDLVWGARRARVFLFQLRGGLPAAAMARFERHPPLCCATISNRQTRVAGATIDSRPAPRGRFDRPRRHFDRAEGLETPSTAAATQLKPQTDQTSRPPRFVRLLVARSLPCRSPRRAERSRRRSRGGVRICAYEQKQGAYSRRLFVFFKLAARRSFSLSSFCCVVFQRVKASIRTSGGS